MFSNYFEEVGEKAAFEPTIEYNISVTFSAKNGMDQVNKSISPGKWNG